MKAKILEKRKKWLDKLTAQSLEKWSKDADKWRGFSGTLKYFGIQQSGNVFELDSSEANSYFRQSLNLFKIALQKQIAKENIGIPSLDQPPAYDALITIVGFSPEPLMHTALALAPKKVYPVATEESAEYYKVPLSPETRKPDGCLQYFEAIIEHYKEPSQTITVEPIRRNVASIGSLDTFKRVKEIIQTVKKDDPDTKIALDITGGKKSADVAAFLVGAIEDDIDIFYVDFEEYDEGGPKRGTEFLNKLDNPYKIYTVKEDHLIKNYWDKGNFSAIRVLANILIKESLTEDMVKRYELWDKRKKYEEIRNAAACYEAWSRFDYQEAMDSLFDGQAHHGDALDELVKCPSTFGNKVKCQESQSELAIKLAIDRYMRGKDAFQCSEWNRAALCYTQSVESILRFAFSIFKENMIIEKVNKKRAIDMLCELFPVKRQEIKNQEGRTIKVEYLYDQHKYKYMFAGQALFERIRDNVLFKRNELAHFQCVSVKGGETNKEKEIKDIMCQMDKTVYDFLRHFTDAYNIDMNIIDAFCRQVSFLQLDDNLQFIKVD